jgi:hypothetical protein
MTPLGSSSSPRGERGRRPLAGERQPADVGEPTAAEKPFHWGRYPSVFNLGEQPQQIATQLMPIAIGEPGGAISFEHFGDRIRGRNFV